MTQTASPEPESIAEMSPEYPSNERLRALEVRAETTEATLTEHKDEIALLRRYVIAAEKAAEIEKQNHATSLSEQRKLLTIFGVFVSAMAVGAPFIRELIFGG